MDYTQIVMGILAITCTVLGWFARQVWTATLKLKEDLNELKILVGTEYVRYDRLQDALKPVMDSLHEIKVTLAGKADK
jgi:hypothetical protein